MLYASIFSSVGHVRMYFMFIMHCLVEALNIRNCIYCIDYLDTSVTHVQLSGISSIVEMDLRQIMYDKPMFIIGHNYYALRNNMLCIAMWYDHYMSLYFKQVVKSNSILIKFVLMINIPGINKLYTYRFIKQYMFRNCYGICNYVS